MITYLNFIYFSLLFDRELSQAHLPANQKPLDPILGISLYVGIIILIFQTEKFAN